MKRQLKQRWAVLTVAVLVLMIVAAVISACQSNAADVASQNLSTAADNFEVTRRIVFYNGITGEYMLVIQGRCSLGNHDAAGELTVTCKVGDNQYKKHFLGLSDNVTYFAEQVDAVQADPYQYRVIFRPTTLVPNVQLDLPKPAQ